MPAPMSRLSTLIRSRTASRFAAEEAEDRSLVASLVTVIGGPTLLLGATLYFIGYISWGTYLSAMGLMSAVSDYPLNELLLRGARIAASFVFISIVTGLAILWTLGFAVLAALGDSTWKRISPVATSFVVVTLAAISLKCFYEAATTAGNALADQSKLGHGIPPVVDVQLTKSALAEINLSDAFVQATRSHTAYLLHETEKEIFLLILGTRLDPLDHDSIRSDSIIYRFPRSSIAILSTR
jgi:hypothetical protein